jgi:hypothetical protein
MSKYYYSYFSALELFDHIYHVHYLFCLDTLGSVFDRSRHKRRQERVMDNQNYNMHYTCLTWQEVKGHCALPWARD